MSDYEPPELTPLTKQVQQLANANYYYHIQILWFVQASPLSFQYQAWYTDKIQFLPSRDSGREWSRSKI